MEPKEPRLYRRKKTWWVKYYVFNGTRDRRVRHSLKTTGEKEAQKKLVERKLGQAAGNIYRFKAKIQIHDYVLVPDGEKGYIGKMDSDYQYDPSVDNDNDGYPHQRKWRCREFFSNRFSEG